MPLGRGGSFPDRPFIEATGKGMHPPLHVLAPLSSCLVSGRLSRAVTIDCVFGGVAGSASVASQTGPPSRLRPCHDGSRRGSERPEMRKDPENERERERAISLPGRTAWSACVDVCVCLCVCVCMHVFMYVCVPDPGSVPLGGRSAVDVIRRHAWEHCR